MSDKRQPAEQYPGDEAPIEDRLDWSVRVLKASNADRGEGKTIPIGQARAIQTLLVTCLVGQHDDEAARHTAKTLIDTLVLHRLELMLLQDTSTFEKIRALVIDKLLTNAAQEAEDGSAMAATFEGKPIRTTDALHARLSMAGLTEVWTAYVHWRDEVMPGLDLDQQSFTRPLDGRLIYIHEDPEAFTMMFLDEY